MQCLRICSISSKPGQAELKLNFSLCFDFLLTTSPLRHTIPPNNIPKTLTRTSTLQSDFQRAEPLVEYAGIETNVV